MEQTAPADEEGPVEAVAVVCADDKAEVELVGGSGDAEGKAAPEDEGELVDDSPEGVKQEQDGDGGQQVSCMACY